MIDNAADSGQNEIQLAGRGKEGVAENKVGHRCWTLSACAHEGGVEIYIVLGNRDFEEGQAWLVALKWCIRLILVPEPQDIFPTFLQTKIWKGLIIGD